MIRAKYSIQYLGTSIYFYDKENKKKGHLEWKDMDGNAEYAQPMVLRDNDA